MDLNEIRKEIDKVNENIAWQFVRRMDLVKKVAEYKIENNMPVLDKDREKQLIANILSKTDHEYKDYTQQFLEDLLAISRKMQHDIIGKRQNVDEQEVDIKLPTVAYLGVPGSFSEQAVIEYFKEDAKAVSVKSFNEIIQKVEDGTYDMAMIPVENSSTGSVNQSIDFLVNHDVSIIGEHIVKVRHFLLGCEGSGLSSIRRAVSHPQALEQCGDFLRRHNVFPVPVQSTADAAKDVAAACDKTVAAIASRRAGKIYNLNVIAEDIQTNNSNYTRFVAIAKSPKDDIEADKISIICSIEHKPGTLHTLLDIFSKHGLNLLQLFSRPIANVPWQYRFHLDFSGNIKDKNVVDALKEAEGYCTDIKMLGNYRSYKSDTI